MADQVFVSPGIYTAEKDLTFVTSNIGVTTLGLVGETKKGPAFTPTFVSSYKEFNSYFGGQDTEKFGDGKPKYELPYIARSFLTQANQLWVTRVLGYSGYDADLAWVITARGNSTYNGMVLATLRSGGSYAGDTFTRDVTGSSDLVMVTTGATYSGVTSNPYSSFVLSGTSAGTPFTYEVSLKPNNKNYITKVLGTDPKDQKAKVWVEEIYANTLSWLYDQGYVTGLTATLTNVPDIGNMQQQYQTPETPYVVSEMRGNKVDRLFKLVMISDGNSANFEVKFSIQNVNFDTQEFDLVIRDYFDTDANPVILESFTRCTMNPATAGFIGTKIGTLDGEYALKSKYVMVDLADKFPTDAIPAGFEGYVLREYTGATKHIALYKTSYATTDKVKKVYLGLSDTKEYDTDLFKYKGADAGNDAWTGRTKGFHMDSGATAAIGSVTYDVGAAEFRSTAGVAGTTYESIRARKFTFVAYGGFDGWDIYRTSRTNRDKYVVNGTGASTGYCGTSFALGVGGFPQTDYYAYYDAIRSMENPEAVNVNIFATPGIDYVDQPSLVNEALDMIETDRRDSIYIITTPDYSTVDEATDALDTAGLDSSYAATYFPWIQMKDVENGTQIWLPPTLEVVRNMAYTDNVAHPWFASAGESRGITNAIKARIKLRMEDRDDLYKNRLNPMGTFANKGVLIWGNKTLQVRESALDRINIRRLLLQVRKLVSSISTRLIFDQDDATVVAEFRRLVNPIMQAIQRDRGLTEFRIDVTTTPEQLDRNELTGKIFLKPTPALEFIGLDFVLSPQGASFDNI